MVNMRVVVGKKFVKLLGGIFVLFVLLLLFIPPLLYFYFRQFIYTSIDTVPIEKHQLMILGAGVIDGDTPSHALQERLNTAVALYQQGKVSTILVSGARDSDFYDEPKVMKEALEAAGVDSSIITQDGEGLRTYDSCYRVKNEYKLDNIIVISQGYHLPRALFLCKMLGVQSTGVYSVGVFSTYYSRWYTIREVLAMYAAVWDIVRQ
jgi:vancomycin permeability regulator SanA